MKKLAINPSNKKYYSDDYIKGWENGVNAQYEATKDAVEVVRCKGCKWHLNGHLCKQLSQYGSIETPPSFYCGFGERIEP